VNLYDDVLSDVLMSVAQYTSLYDYFCEQMLLDLLGTPYRSQTTVSVVCCRGAASILIPVAVPEGCCPQFFSQISFPGVSVTLFICGL